MAYRQSQKVFYLDQINLNNIFQQKWQKNLNDFKKIADY
jgi:hypothetical protein